ncbi:hypothetical protein SANTM175S_00282 [Streptomyces antimycoticus]
MITRLGSIEDIHPGIVEDLFASDLAFLQDFYRRINARARWAAVTCSVPGELRGGSLRWWSPGGIVTYAADRIHEEVAYLTHIEARTGDGHKVAQWGLLEVVPVRWTGPSFNPESPKVAMETIEIAHHGYVMEG